MSEDDTKQPINPPDWGSIDQSVIQEIIRQAELHLAAQLTAAIAADQRATAILSMTIAAATGGLGGGVALMMGDKPNYVLGPSAIALGTCLMVAAWFFLESLKPVAFEFSGNWPHSWYADKNMSANFKLSLGETAENYDVMLKTNDDAIKRNAKLATNGAGALFAAPLVAFFTAMLALMLTTS